MVKATDLTILLAPNSLKGSLNAFEAVDAMKNGLYEGFPGASLIEAPVADGGEMTMDILLRARGGERKQCQVLDPLGRVIHSSYGMLADGRTAVVELAKASGYSLLAPSEMNPLYTTTYGTGQLVQAALEDKAERIIIGLGGSATVDGGAGMLQALGYHLLDRDGVDIPFGGGSLQDITTIVPSDIHPRLSECELLVACDVQNPLLGDEGAAKVFAPQKGAGPDEVNILANGLDHFAQVVERDLDKQVGHIKYGGAAGGIAAALGGILQGQLRNGTDFLLDEIRIEEAIVSSDLIITAEGSLDSQTLRGKAPYGVAQRAKKFNKPIVLLSGQVPPELSSDIQKNFDVVLSIMHGPSTIEKSLRFAATDMERTSFAVGNLIRLSRQL